MVAGDAEVLEFLKRSQDELDEEPNRGLFAPMPLPNRLLAEIVVVVATAIEKEPNYYSFVLHINKTKLAFTHLLPGLHKFCKSSKM